MTLDQALNLAVQKHRAGQLAEAETIYRKILARDGSHADTLHLLGVLAHQMGNDPAAEELIAKAIAVNGGIADYHCHLGVALAGQHKLDQAIAAYRAALQLRPNNVEALGNLGIVLAEQIQWDPAIAAYRKALAITPTPTTYNNLGNALRAKGDFNQAIACFEKALVLRPDSPAILSNLGAARYENRQLRPAISCCRRALEIDPTFFEAQSTLANALEQSGELDEAITAHRRAMALRPASGRAAHNFAHALCATGQLDQAIGEYARAAELEPHNIMPASTRLFFIQYHPGYTADAILREHQLWDQRYAKPLEKLITPHDNQRSEGRRLRVGYVTYNFRDHCSSLFTSPLLANHDHGPFEIFCYAAVIHPNAVTAALRGYADAWRDTLGMHDQQVAEMVRADRIDILVDLDMHMAFGRPLLFARKPAPVQVTWVAYPGTTGLGTMDARLTDPCLDPPGVGDECYTEQSIRLPDTFWCYDAAALKIGPAPPPGPPPAEKNGYVTFGCLNNYFKINPGLLALWGQVLHATPESHLRLLVPRGDCRRRTSEQLQALGIAAGRIELVDFQPRPQYLAEYRNIDLGLDTLPYNGHTTSLDSMWMGVPVITRLGHTVVGRAGWSQLSNLGLTRLAANDDPAFVRIATELAGDLPRVAELRRTLRERMIASPLTDGVKFARGVESAYRRLWRGYCQ